MDEIRWGILGCGDVAEKKSGPAFQRVSNSSLVAVMRRDPAKAADFAQRHHVQKWYCDANSLINDPDVNAVYIATPPSSHEEYALAALKAGKYVYLEKPMALNSASAKRIEDAVSATPGKLVVAHYRRALPTFLKVKEIIDNKIIGDPLSASIRILQPAKSELVATEETNWRTNPAISGGGLFHDLAPHQLDLMINYFGSVRDASGSSANQSKVTQADDIVTGKIEFENGVAFNGLWYFSAPISETSDSCEIIGSKGKISFSFFGTEVLLWKGEEKLTFNFKNPEYVQEPMIEKVVNYFLDKAPNPCAAVQGVAVMRVMDEFTQKKHAR